MEDEEEKLAWFRKAAELNDPDGLYGFAYRVEEEVGVGILCEAAARGHARTMLCLASNFSDRLPPIEVATFVAGHMLYSGWTDFFISLLRDAARRSDKEQADASNVAVSCAAGRELEGYDQLWNKGRRPVTLLLRCFVVLLAMMHRAWRAAL